MARKVAIVEDDFDQRENYADALKQSGYDVSTYSNRESAYKGMQDNMPDLAILDIMLEHEMDGGFDLCRDLRQLSPTLPIIFLTTRDTDIDRVSGLRLDAWDYLTKPLNMQFLSVRINSLFRIVDSLGQPDNNESTNNQIVNQLEINEESMSISWKGQELSLTLTEFWLIESMARHPGHVSMSSNAALPAVPPGLLTAIHMPLRMSSRSSIETPAPRRSSLSFGLFGKATFLSG